MSNSSIRAATAADAQKCLAALTLAFSGDPPCRWTWPDPQQYLEAFPRFAQAFGGAAINHGTAHHCENFTGVALWLAPGAAPDERALSQVIEETVSAEKKAAVFFMFEQMDRFHPHEAHWHLPLIGVDPAHQRKGIGGALLKQGLQLCDSHQLPAYLEATSPVNVPLYQRYGFAPLGTVQVADAPAIVPMLRQPGAKP